MTEDGTQNIVNYVFYNNNYIDGFSLSTYTFKKTIFSTI